MLRCFLFLSMTLVLSAIPSAAREPALEGYDPVAYFVLGKPVRGLASLETVHAGELYRFSSEENRNLFRQDPAKYIPQYGGFCAWAAAHGYLYPASPLAFTVHHGRLFVNANFDVARKFNQDKDRLIERADRNWPGLEQKAARKKGLQ